jgi:hypothetical protein
LGLAGAHAAKIPLTVDEVVNEITGVGGGWLEVLVILFDE